MFNPVQGCAESRVYPEKTKHEDGIRPGWDASTSHHSNGVVLLGGQKLPSPHHKHKPNHLDTLLPTVYTNTPTHSYT